MKKLVVLGLSSLMFGGTLTNDVLAQSILQKQDSNGVAFEVEYSPFFYKWKEPDVKERGMMHRTKLGVSFNFGKFFMRPGISLYGGQVNYDGKTMNDIPIDSNTTYSGYSVELKGGYTFALGDNYKVPIYVILGLEKWKRALDSTSAEVVDDTGEVFIMPVLGYTEKWQSYYSKIGIAPSKDLGNYYIYGDAYVKMPFEIKNKVEFVDVEVKPKKKLGYGVEIGLGMKHFLKCNVNGEIGFFYEYDKFGKSPIEEGNYLGQPISVYQPESKRELFGVKVGIKF